MGFLWFLIGLFSGEAVFCLALLLVYKVDR